MLCNYHIYKFSLFFNMLSTSITYRFLRGIDEMSIIIARLVSANLKIILLEGT